MKTPLSHLKSHASILLLVLVAARCGADAPSGAFSILAPAPQSSIVELSLSPSSPTIPRDTPQSFTARGRSADGSLRDVSAAAQWTITDARGQTAVTAPGGFLTGAPAGTYSVTVAYGGFSVSTPLLITTATLTAVNINPSTATIARGTKQAFTAIATYSDATTKDVTTASTWTIEDVTGSGVAWLDSTGGATGKNVGKASITVRYSGLSSVGALSVTPSVLRSLAISPLAAATTKGSYVNYHASGTFSDGTSQDLSAIAAWSVADVSGTNVVVIDGAGAAFGRDVGRANVAVSFAGVTATTTLDVRPATLTSLSISPTSATIIKGATQQYRVSGNYSDGTVQDLTKLVTWTMDRSGIASIDATGLATASALGGVGLHASYLGHTLGAILTVDYVFTPSVTFASGYLWGIWGSATTDIWTVGDVGTILHWNGTAWSSVSSPTTKPLYGLWGASSTNIWATGADNTILHYDGTSWSSVTTPAGTGVLTSIWGFSATDVWAGGPGQFLHWNGTSWSVVMSANGNQITGIWGSSSTNIWAVTSPGTFLRWDGTSWKESLALGSVNLWGISGSSGTDAIAVGESGYSYRWNGSNWLGNSPGTGRNLINVRSNGPSDVWVTSDGGSLYHWDSSGWSSFNTPTTQNLLGVWTSGITVWATGWNGVTLHYP